jgi:hypothetical protein
VQFVAFWYIFPFWYVWIKKNLATLLARVKTGRRNSCLDSWTVDSILKPLWQNINTLTQVEAELHFMYVGGYSQNYDIIWGIRRVGRIKQFCLMEEVITNYIHT